jgi:hypothetical protein
MNQTASPDPIAGPSERKAADRLRQHGSIELLMARRGSLFALALGLPREPMLLLLVGLRRRD